ncbi:BadF/BadG/BcrA/BcrD ATPase family protein [Rurimicrobium arvi]
MATKLIAESGSTKTDWVLLRNGKILEQIKTDGFNPNLQSAGDIVAALQQQLQLKHKPDEIFFYGAGVNSRITGLLVKNALKAFFHTTKISVENDILAAARGLCANKKGMVCILGTGSNACYYDGKKIREQLASLGFIAGDEGSGNHMGKRILQHYAYNTFDAELRQYFEEHFGNDLNEIITHLYKQPFPNRYLASFAPLLADNRGHFMVENIIEDCFNDFFHHHLLKYRQSWRNPIYFTGSIAYTFSDVIRNLCDQYEFELGTIEKNPMKGLIAYHK